MSLNASPDRGAMFTDISCTEELSTSRSRKDRNTVIVSLGSGL